MKNIYRILQINKKMIDKIKDEMNGKILEQFIGLTSDLSRTNPFLNDMARAKDISR